MAEKPQPPSPATPPKAQEGLDDRFTDREDRFASISDRTEKFIDTSDRWEASHQYTDTKDKPVSNAAKNAQTDLDIPTNLNAQAEAKPQQSEVQTTPAPETQELVESPATQANTSSAEKKVSTPPPPKAPKRNSDDIEYIIHGNDIQFVEVILDPNETAVGEPGAMMYMDEGIQMKSSISDGSDTGSGMLGSLVGAAKRKLSGEKAFMGNFKNIANGKKTVAFTSPFPGHIIALDLLKLGRKVFCQKDAFLCAAKGTSVGIGFTRKLGAGWWGGESFMLQTVEGDGLAFIHAGGSIIEKTLADGEVIYVDTGSIVGFQNGVDFDIQMIKGMKNIMFGGEDMFLSTLTGPGKIWIQSMPYPRLISTIADAISSNAEE